MWIWLVYEGYDVEDALDYVLEWNKNPFYLLRYWYDKETLKDILSKVKNIKLKKVSEQLL